MTTEKKYSFLIMFLFLSILFSCSDNEDPVVIDDTDDSDVEVIENEYEYVNDWIYENMDVYYFWTDELPSDPDNTLDPESYFESLLYAYDEDTNPEGDRFSFISDDAESLLAEFSGESKSTGMQFRLFYKSSTSDEIIAQIIYVIPDSPADEAGLIRGDIITRVNGTMLTDENYYDLLFENTDFTLTLADYTYSGFNEHSETVAVSAVVLQENPIFLDSIYDMNGTKVGYLVYNQFIPGHGR